jgi:7,8-dihydropterin-6-yl-methyl-4-(beta-D-ribofuranosyl)aminobenzene 5'-phosphate synthase
MKVTVLVDNNTLIDQYYIGEPGIAFFLECDGKKYLFDTGFSDVFLQNACKMNINLLSLDAVVLSHGHNDHTWGLSELLKLYSKNSHIGDVSSKPLVLAHPDVFLPRFCNGADIGSLITVERLKQTFTLELSKEPVWLTDKLVFLGEIVRNNNFEALSPLGEIRRSDIWEDDFIYDDSALAYKSDKGLVIITGCSHAGICNIIEQARRICKEDRVYDIIGGFHLLNPLSDRLNKTVDYFRELKPKAVHSCHCTDLQSKISLAQVTNVEEVGVGLVLEY